MDVLRSSGSALAAAIREGRLTSRDVVERHIERIEAVNARINAVVAKRYDQARREADVADARVRETGGRGLPPFWGVPCTIKECFAMVGMPHTAGLVSRRGTIASRDATAVARLKAAGVIPLGVTNLSELCMWVESTNLVYGRTRNPYDGSRTPGGSSGGEGAIIGVGGSPFGLGSDIGGSIRLPAYFNGVFGHKPSGGLVPGTGQYPIAENAALRYLTTGPLARRAEDLYPLLKILAGPDGEDTGCEPMALGDPASVDIGRLRVVSIFGDGMLPVRRELADAQVRVAEHLRGRGARVQVVKLPALRRSLEIWSAMMHAAGGATFGELLGTPRTSDVLRHLVRAVVGRSPHTSPALLLALIEHLPNAAPAHSRKMVLLGRELYDRMAALLGDDGILLYPTYGAIAPRHGWPMVPPYRWAHTAIFNALQMPVTQVPLGLGRHGLPLGLQVVGLHGHDHRTIAVGMELERAFGGWVPPRQS